jgi:hypothetical protein
VPFRKLFTITVVILVSVNAHSANPDSTNTKRNYLPSTAHFQFAGFIGMCCAGFGYHYWKERGNISLFYGYVPTKYASTAIHTVALKNTLSLLTIDKHLRAVPIVYAGFTLNCEISKHAFITLPDFYPAGYYNTQAVHFTFLTGFKVKFPLKNNYAIEPYAELGTLDTYLWYSIKNSSVDLDDVIKLALGVNFKLR